MTAVLLVLGTALMLVAAVGVLRMPDLYSRMQASSKAATLGAVCVLVGVTIDFADISIALRAGLVCIFLFLTGPLAAHMIARAGYITGAPLAEEAVIDELRGKYDLTSGRLSGTD